MQNVIPNTKEENCFNELNLIKHRRAYFTNVDKQANEYQAKADEFRL